jgi:hypothetical protein
MGEKFMLPWPDRPAQAEGSLFPGFDGFYIHFLLLKPIFRSTDLQIKALLHCYIRNNYPIIAL